MNDFRINKIREELKRVNITESFFNELEKVVCYDNYIYFSFSDSHYVGYNAICMEVPESNYNLINSLCETVNNQSQILHFEVKNGLLIASSVIQNSIFMRNDADSELFPSLCRIINETKSVTKVMYQFSENLNNTKN